MNKAINLLFIFILMQLGFLQKSLAEATTNFFDQRYHGWVWFDQQEKEKKVEKSIPTPTKAAQNIAKRKQALEDTRNIMIELAYDKEFSEEQFIEAVRRYRLLEKQMQVSALRVGSAWDQTNLLYPNFADELERPSNLYGRKTKEEVDTANEDRILKELAGKVELFIFRKAGCPYCPKLEKHLDRFAKKHGFKVEAVSPDNSKSSYFKTTSRPELIKLLGLKLMPTVIMVTNDSKARFEIARGLVSVPDLREKSLIAASLIESGFRQNGGK